MNSRGTYKCSFEDGDVDRISNLPEPIISSILSLLPTKYAVATSILSKGWRFRWTNVTSFDFDDESWPADSGKSESDTSESGSSESDMSESAHISESGGSESDIAESGSSESDGSESAHNSESGGSESDIPESNSSESDIAESGSSESDIHELNRSESDISESGSSESGDYEWPQGNGTIYSPYELTTCPFCPGLNSILYEVVHGDIAEKTSFVQFVQSVMENASLLKSDKFRLHCGSPDLLSKWVNFAIDRKVRVLDLTLLSRPGSAARFPDALYTSGTLEVLKIVGPIQLILPRVVSLPKLTDLELNKVIYESDASFSQLISGCPVLQSLTFKRIAPMIRLWGSCDTGLSDNLVVSTISSPSMKYLAIYFEYEWSCMPSDAIEHARMEYFRLGMSHRSKKTCMKLEIDAPLLECLKLHDNMSVAVSMLSSNLVNEVDIDVLIEDTKGTFDQFSSETDEGDKFDDASSFPHDSFFKYNVVVDLVDNFDGVKVMKLGKRTMKALKEGSVSVYKRFERLTKLVILDESCEWSTLIDLIDNCPNLEVLDICDTKDGMLEWYLSKDDVTFGHQRDIDIDIDTDIDTYVPGCLSSSLKQVIVRHFAGYPKREMALLQFFLKYGSVMERLSLCFYKSVDSKRKSDALNEVSRFSRKSPTCEISVCDE